MTQAHHPHRQRSHRWARQESKARYRDRFEFASARFTDLRQLMHPLIKPTVSAASTSTVARSRSNLQLLYSVRSNRVQKRSLYNRKEDAGPLLGIESAMPASWFGDEPHV